MLKNSNTGTPVDVVLDGEREGEVNDIVHAGDVKSTSRHVCGHQQRNLSALEVFHCKSPELSIMINMFSIIH
jgi:hypothetical protein